MSKVCLCRGITEEQNVEAIKNGYSVTEEEIEEYLKELKTPLKSCLSDEEYNNICSAYGGESEYWQYEYEVYQMNFPIQNYVKDIEEEYKKKYDKQYSADEIEQMWGNEFERIKEKLVEEQNISSWGVCNSGCVLPVKDI